MNYILNLYISNPILLAIITCITIYIIFSIVKSSINMLFPILLYGIIFYIIAFKKDYILKLIHNNPISLLAKSSMGTQMPEDSTSGLVSTLALQNNINFIFILIIIFFVIITTIIYNKHLKYMMSLFLASTQSKDNSILNSLFNYKATPKLVRLFYISRIMKNNLLSLIQDHDFKQLAASPEYLRLLINNLKHHKNIMQNDFIPIPSSPEINKYISKQDADEHIIKCIEYLNNIKIYNLKQDNKINYIINHLVTHCTEMPQNQSEEQAELINTILDALHNHINKYITNILPNHELLENIEYNQILEVLIKHKFNKILKSCLYISNEHLLDMISNNLIDINNIPRDLYVWDAKIKHYQILTMQHYKNIAPKQV